MNHFTFLSCSVKDSVAFSEINESVSIESKIACSDESKIFCMKGFIELN